MANTNITYNNPNKANANKIDNSNRFKVNQQVLNMIARSPALGMGYIIGSMLGDNYWGKKRNKSMNNADDDFYKKYGGAIGADANGVYGANNNSNGAVKYQGKPDTDWSAYNKALDSVPRTPAQANKPAVTLENAGNGGGVPTLADVWNNMANGSTYNYGGTPLYTGGVRNLGNVIGADANGVYGVPNGGSAPSVDNIPRSPQTKAPNPNPTPIPYTPEQLAQIQQYGGFTPEELQRMGASELVAPAQGQAQPDGGGDSGGNGIGGLLASAVANAVANEATNPQTPAPPPAPPVGVLNPLSEDRDHEPYYANPMSESDDHDLQNLAINNANQQRSLNWLKRKQMEAPKTYSIDINGIFNALKPAHDPYSNILKKRT